MTRQDRLRTTVALVALDASCIAGALAAAYYLRITSGLFSYTSLYDPGTYLVITATVLPLWLVLCAMARLYDSDIYFGAFHEPLRIIKACTFGMLSLILVSFFWHHDGMISRGWLLSSWGFAILFLIAGRRIMRRWLARCRARGRLISRLVIIGANEHSKTLARQFEPATVSGVQVVGFLDDYLPVGTPVLDRVTVLGSPHEIDRVVKEQQVDEILVMSESLAWESLREIIGHTATNSDNVGVKLYPGVQEIFMAGLTVVRMADVPLLSVQESRIAGPDRLLKNLLDYGLGGLLLVISLPLMAVLALAVAILDGRPVIEQSLVRGLRNRHFVTHKFRTGYSGLSRRSLLLPETLQVARDTGTWIGYFLYRTGLDKLPQLFDVLQGHMSLVGPRTILVSDQSCHAEWLSNILSVKPGMTGRWAITTLPCLEDEIFLTFHYIQHWNLWLDLQILVQTATAMASRRIPRRLYREPAPRPELFPLPSRVPSQPLRG
jgi:lipopolysaccharide/colanic/teichoic acid biosynthesis glycosyltransferase